MSDLQPFQERVVTEKKELDEKIEKLLAFTKTEAFASLPNSEQSLLGRQSEAMVQYSVVLGARITAFG